MTPLDGATVEPFATKRSEPRVPFETVVALGLIEAGTMLWDADARVHAQVRPDGTLASGTNRGSIHRLGAQVQGRAACNGWTYWHVERGGRLEPIDALRAEARLRLGLQAVPELIAAE